MWCLIEEHHQKLLIQLQIYHLQQNDHPPEPDFTTIIPNLAIKMTILHWCDSSCTQHPLPPDYASLERHVREQRDKEQEKENLIRVSQKELLDVVADNPPIIFSHATTELGPRVNHFNSRAQSQQGVWWSV